MLDLILIFRIILAVITALFLFGALLNNEKNKWDWEIIIYLLVILIYVIMR